MSDVTATHLTWHKEGPLDDIVFSGRWCASDMQKLDLDPIERALLGEPVVTAADMLQTLQLLFFRLQHASLAKEDGA